MPYCSCCNIYLFEMAFRYIQSHFNIVCTLHLLHINMVNRQWCNSHYHELYLTFTQKCIGCLLQLMIMANGLALVKLQMVYLRYSQKTKWNNGTYNRRKYVYFHLQRRFNNKTELQIHWRILRKFFTISHNL